MIEIYSLTAVIERSWLHSPSHGRKAKGYGGCQGGAGSQQEWLADDSGSSRRLGGEGLFRAESGHKEEALYLSKSLWQVCLKEVDVIIGCHISPAGTCSNIGQLIAVWRSLVAFGRWVQLEKKTLKFVFWLCSWSSSLVWAGRLMPLPSQPGTVSHQHPPSTRMAWTFKLWAR